MEMSTGVSLLRTAQSLLTGRTILVVAKAKFLRRKPSVLVALEEISEMC